MLRHKRFNTDNDRPERLILERGLTGLVIRPTSHQMSLFCRLHTSSSETTVATHDNLRLCSIHSHHATPALSTFSHILQPLTRPPRLQLTPVLVEVEARLVLFIGEQRGVAQLRASGRLRPQAQADRVGAVIVDHAGREGEPCLWADLGDELAIWRWFVSAEEP